MDANLQAIVQRMVTANEPEDNIRVVIEHYGASAAPKPKATPPPASATIGMIDQSTKKGDPQPEQPFGSLGIQTVSDKDWGQMTAQQRMQGVLRAVGNTVLGSGGRDAIDNPKTTLATAALPLVGKAAEAVPGILEGGKRLAGISKLRAGANIGAAATAAKDVALNTEGVGTEGLRALELQAAGGRLPRVASQLMQRITSPDAGDLTFEEARDFYSNLSRLSANEFGNLNPTMQRQLGAMKDALHQALVDAAGTVGKGEEYASGISEYAKASRAGAKWENSVKPALMTVLKRVAQGTGLAAGYDVAKRVLD